MVKKNVRERFQTKFFGDRRARATFRTVRLKNILKRRESFTLSNRSFQLVGQQIAFGQGFEDRLTTLVQFRQIQKPFANARQRNLVQ